MDKNWLIRTKSNHILGPVSKEKVVELYQNGSIKPDDEVCSGNGYWFFIREEDMVERFLTGNEVQSFNPISEAKDILLPQGPSRKTSQVENEDITMVGGLNISALKEVEVSGPPPEDQLIQQKTNSTQAETTPVEHKKKINPK